MALDLPDNILGVVVIGRNEGARLVRCLESLQGVLANTVYVDSGSSDHSVANANQLGAHVLALDMSKPFTAARARNAGMQALLDRNPQTKYIQFVDGDCEVLAGWVEAGVHFLSENTQVAAVSGELIERFPQQSIYNAMCDLEWKMPRGEVKYCGGNVMMRVEAIAQTGGFLDSLIAGEEPELCVRLRKNGWKIWHISQQMMLHDAAMTSFSQWWKRSVRAGYAFAQGADLHGQAPEFHWVEETKRARRWGGYIPLLALGLVMLNPYYGLLVLLVYPMQMLRMFLKSPQPRKIAAAQAFFLTIGKFAEFFGQVKFYWQRATKRDGTLIEYK